MVSTDIDIDVADRNMALAYLSHIPASQNLKGKMVKHNTGVYFQNIPQDPLTDLSTIEYQAAEEMGYFKIDLLNNSLYGEISSNTQVERLMNIDPPWEILSDPLFTDQIAHIHGHQDIVDVIKPQSIIDLAIVLALIRPGKRHLLYRSKEEIQADIWTKPADGSYHFKKAHAVSYAVSLVVQINHLVEKLSG